MENLVKAIETYKEVFKKMNDEEFKEAICRGDVVGMLENIAKQLEDK